MSQEPWPCNGEDPWLSSKGHTMCVGKAIICSLGPSRIVWSENGPCCGTIAYFVGGKEGRIWSNIICLKLYQLKRILWWCLSFLESVMEAALQYVMKSILLEKILTKSWSPGIFVIPTSWTHHVGLHVDFSSTNFCWAFTPSPPSVKWTWTVSAFSTNESSYIALVKGLQPCVWSGPKKILMPPPHLTLANNQRLP